MELRDIELFLTLAEELHFGRTAERLHVSVSRVSQAIRSQEIEIGAPLFRRTSRKVELTPVGELLRAGLRPAYDGIRRSISDARDLAGHSADILTIGTMGAQRVELDPILEAYRSAHPFSELRFREVFFSDPFGGLRRHEVDLVTAWLPIAEPDLAVGCVLREEPLRLLVSDQHPLASRSSVSLEDLADWALPATATTAPESWLSAVAPLRTPSGRPVPRRHEVATYPEILAVVASGDVVSTVPDEGRRYYSWPGVTYLPIHDAEPVRWALIRRRERMTPVMRAFLDLAARART
ncbi:LysR substrate-binding domain-containing protein [Microbacterium sp. ARD32]|uniref:LysR family transcriptional regulator n=1 Tax=Microbacterium sp. ARD32 TaxID=2962577 RepID=UPI0028819BB8|nr:LysR substrate-binding domain-containing protein [Microbacterium sp. ARD32]MDT0158275.1 LysR substrate-binding domain-containing protein [Microbacterium sp. ARD32]